VSAFLAGAFYAPHIAITWSGGEHNHSSVGLYASVGQYAEIIMFFGVGALTGILADRERKRKEELQRTTEKLGEVYRELQSSFEQIKRADKLSAVGQLSAGLAHEIRNPLASIDGAAEILEENSVNPEIRKETVGIIRKECARLNRLLSSLLDFARPRAPEWHSIDVEHMFDSVVQLLSHSTAKGISFQAYADGMLPRITGDPEQIRQVILNLAINAAQAMPGGGEVRLVARQQGSEVVIDIIDQGEGIPEENLDKIFDPFFTTKHDGTGLGLSVVHRIVAQHHGTVSASRNAGAGMTFTLRLPAASEDIRHAT
jgi:signal transduction histidine kinase